MERLRGLAFPLTLFASVVVLSMSSELITIQAQADTETNQTSESIITTPESLPPSEVTEAEVTEVTEETIVETVETPEVAPVETDLVIETLSVEEEDYSTGTVINHTVVAGEYLTLIARNYGVTVNELRLWNHLTTDTLQIGQVLKVIPGTTTPVETPSEDDDHSGGVVSYVVKAGDNLWSISQRFGVTMNDLRLWNHLTSDTLQIGQVLKVIPDITDPTYPEDPDDHSGDVVTYIVKAGDTLWGIANRFDVSLNNLRLWNHLTTDLLRIGQELKMIPPLPGPTDPVEEPGSVTTYTVKAGDTLWAISQRFGVTVQQLRTWNQLTSDILQIDKQLTLVAKDTTPPPTSENTIHVVQAGDTLWAIGQQYGVSVNQIKQWNQLTSNFLSIGQRLSIGTPTTTPPVDNQTKYIVKSGDTLWSIANRYGVTVSHLKQWNNLTSNLLAIGQILIVSGEVEAQPPVTTRYTVKAGDTLWSISRHYGVTVSQLMSWNNLTSNFLAIGQVLNVNQPNVTYTVKSGDSLWKIAVQFGVTIEQLKNWNGLTSNVIYVNQQLIVK